MPLLTTVVPAYNAEDYLGRAVDSLIAGLRDIEIIIVDDGSTDSTPQLAERYAEAFPSMVRVVHKPNGGHGSAINAGLAEARGEFIKIVDADDWLSPYAYDLLLDKLQTFREQEVDVDLVISNFVYEKEGKHHKKAERYASAMPVGQLFGWDEVGKFRPWQYMLMHSMVYRTSVLRESGLQLPEHTFYVDNLYAFVPLAHVRRMYYLDVDLYRYYVGREDQSVNEKVMLGRIDQHLRVVREMYTRLSEAHRTGLVSLTSGAGAYMVHYLKVLSIATSGLMTIHRDPEMLAKKRALWEWMGSEDTELADVLRRGPMGRVTRLDGKRQDLVTIAGYHTARAVIGFN